MIEDAFEMGFIEEVRWLMKQDVSTIYFVFFFVLPTGKCANQSWQASRHTIILENISPLCAEF